jgi:hypothetical protein
VRLLALVIACAGCGRLGFDDVAAVAHDATPEGAGDATDAPAGPTKIYTVSGNGVQPGELFEVDLTTGQLTLLGNIPPAFGTLIGLAYWDSNTMYGEGTSFVKITLSPFTVTADVGPVGDFSALERVGNALVGISQTTSLVTQFVPGNAVGMTSTAMLVPAASGGDITRTSDGTWYWWTNSTHQLCTIDLTTAVATPVGGPNVGAQFMTGLVHDDAGRLFLIGPKIYPVDKTTGVVGAQIDACKACPTPYGLSSGDTTRSP